jgi:hypothetical protein
LCQLWQQGVEKSSCDCRLINAQCLHCYRLGSNNPAAHPASTAA